MCCRGSDGPNYRSDGIRIIVDLKPDHGVSSKRYDASLDRGSHGPQWQFSKGFHSAVHQLVYFLG